MAPARTLPVAIVALALWLAGCVTPPSSPDASADGPAAPRFAARGFDAEANGSVEL